MKRDTGLNTMPSVRELYSLLSQKKECWRPGEDFDNLPGYWDKDGEEHPFLGDLALRELCLPEAPGEDRIDFTGRIRKTELPFLQEIFCREALGEEMTVNCSLVWWGRDNLVFTAYGNLGEAAVTFQGIQVFLSTFAFHSGMAEMLWQQPGFTYEGMLQGTGRAFPVRLWEGAGEKSLELEGNFQEVGEMDLEVLLALLGLGAGVFSLGEYLPPCLEQGLFHSIVLRSVSLNLTRGISGEEVNDIRMELGLKAPWKITEQISLEPVVRMQVIKPFSPQGRFVSFRVMGEWRLGGTVYEVFADPALGNYSLRMKEGETLDFGAAAAWFSGAELPALGIDRLSLEADFVRERYSFTLGASQLWRFTLCGRELSVDQVELKVWGEKGAYRVALQGTFSFAGVEFGLYGAYGKGGNYRISASVREAVSMGMGVLLRETGAGDISLPGEMSGFRILDLELACQGGEEAAFSFDCRVSLDSGDGILDRAFSQGACAAFGGRRTGQEGWSFDFEASARVVLPGGQALGCRYLYDGSAQAGSNLISLVYEPVDPAHIVTFAVLLEAAGITGLKENVGFLGEIGIGKAELSYDFTRKEMTGEVVLSSGGSLEVKFLLGEQREYLAVMKSTVVLSLGNLPVVGGIVERFAPPKEMFSISNLTLHAGSAGYATEEYPPGMGLEFRAFNQKHHWQIYEKKQRQRMDMEPGSGLSTKTYWLNLEKTVAVFSLHRMGLSLDGGRLGILFDASLNAAPLTFDALGLGLYADMRNPEKVSFALSGLGVSVSRPPLEISGAFLKSGQEGREVYGGSLLVRWAGFTAFALGQYSQGALMAYACVDGALGGPPAFYVTGLALGFGYNENLALPDIEQVASYPLIQGARGEVGREALPGKLAEYVTPCEGQNFLAAGVRFTSFEVADCFALVTVAFGKRLQVGLLGLGDITMPPRCSDNPIAHAQLALRASFTPEEGCFTAQAQLTSESYIFSRACRLTGGFAFCLWFDGEHRGDFVVTLGGYHPRYEKPTHYPDVPRLGFRWDVIPQKPGRLVLGGEIYFALTPSAVMAGGLLSAVYTDGNLRAWFTARADFLISWKPFHYDARIGVSLGASYRLKVWFISHTFKVELGCDLHIWGPDFSGRARITWFILSFTISFGAGAQEKPEKITWGDFADSFLPRESRSPEPNRAGGPAPLTISISQGIRGEKREQDSQVSVPIVCPEKLKLTAATAIPCTDAVVAGKELFSGQKGCYVRPVQARLDKSLLTVSLFRVEDGGEERELTPGAEELDAGLLRRSMPSALWGEQEYERELVPNAVCGALCSLLPREEGMFPKKCFISEELLCGLNPLVKPDAFDFSGRCRFPVYEAMGTVNTVRETGFRLKEEGREFLASMGYRGDCEISRFAAGAHSWLDEDVLVGDLPRF